MSVSSIRRPQNSSGGGSPLEFDLTIQGELAKVKDHKERFPAANLLYTLLRYLSINVNSAERNIHTSAQVLVRSNRLYESVIQTMDTLDKSSFEALDQNWALFDNYTTVIPLLERILLNVANSTEKRAHSPPAMSTQDGVQHIATWLKDRYVLKEALDSLKQKSLLQDVPSESVQLIVADHIMHRTKDDYSTLRVLHDFIANDKLTDGQIMQRRGQRLVTDVKALVREIIQRLSQRPPSEDVSGVVVRAIMTVYIPFSVLAFPNTTVPWQLYLKTNEIWVSLKTILTKVKGYIEKPPGPAATLDTEFERLEKLLLKLTDTVVETADEIFELIRLAAVIHRPYSGRTAALVKTIGYVDQVSRKRSALAVHRFNLQQYIRTAIDYLNEVKNSRYDLNTFSLDSQDYKDQKEKHASLFNDISSLYTSCGIPTSEWKNQNLAYTTAVAVDETNIKDAKEMLYQATYGAK